MNFDAYGVKTLHQSIALLNHANTEGLSLDELRALLGNYLKGARTHGAVPQPAPKKCSKKCPDCKKVMRFCNRSKIWECGCGRSSL